MVHHRIRHDVGLFDYCTSQGDLSNSLRNDPNKDHMKMLRPQEVDVPTYHFVVHKTIGISYSRLIFRVNYIQMHVLGTFHYCTT